MKQLKLYVAAALLLGMMSCSTLNSGSREENSYTTVAPKIESYNELTMDLDPTGVTYTIDYSTPEGRLKLKNISLREAQQLALVECLMKYNCATLFNPQYTHLKKGKNILRVTVYGFPARYKKAEPEKVTEKETVDEVNTNAEGQSVSTSKTTTRERTLPKKPLPPKRKTKVVIL